MEPFSCPVSRGGSVAERELKTRSYAMQRYIEIKSKTWTYLSPGERETVKGSPNRTLRVVGSPWRSL